MNSDNDSVFIKSALSASNTDAYSATSNMNTLSATSDAFLGNNFSATSSASIPENFDLNSLETSVSELNNTVNRTLGSSKLPSDLELELKKLLTDTENRVPVAFGGNSASKKYRINEGKANGRRTRGVKSYETDADDDLSPVSADEATSEFSLDDSDSADKMSDKSNKSRKNDPLKPHRDFVAHIQKVMGVKGGPALQVFAKMYKDEAKEMNPDKSSIELTKDAQKLFDKDSKDERQKKYQQAVKKLADKKK